MRYVLRAAASRLPKAFVTTLLAVAAFCTVAPSAHAQTPLPPSLQGESFEAYEITDVAPVGSVAVSGDCTPTAGETLTYTYQAEGVATGPYPGTFRESGTVTATVTDLPPPVGMKYGLVATWTAEFSIDSPVGDVTGTKTFRQETASNSYFTCLGPPSRVFHRAAAGSLSYEATISPATGGTFRDEGEAQASFASQRCDPAGTVNLCFPAGYEYDTFQELFYLSTGVQPITACAPGDDDDDDDGPENSDENLLDRDSDDDGRRDGDDDSDEDGRGDEDEDDGSDDECPDSGGDDEDDEDDEDGDDDDDDDDDDD